MNTNLTQSQLFLRALSEARKSPVLLPDTTDIDLREAVQASVERNPSATPSFVAAMALLAIEEQYSDPREI